MPSAKKLRLKLVVDKEKKRVLFAESDKDFVDILFSFLTIPVGAIIRLLNKQTGLGCMDKLYESIEKLNDMYFNTEACKVMLLNPLSACRSHYYDLILRIDSDQPQILYACSKDECRTKSFPYFSSVPKARCGCGAIMDSSWYCERKDWKGPNGDGVFVKRTANFLITDDLRVMPASTATTQSVFEKLEIKDWGSIEETVIDLDVDKLRHLFKRSLLSKHPLSDMYFQEPNIIDNVKFQSKSTTLPKIVEDWTKQSKRLKAKLHKCQFSIEEDLTKESKRLKAKFLICKSSKKLRHLFKRSLLSKHPLSDMYFQEPNIIDNVKFQSKSTTLPKIEEDLTKESKRLKEEDLTKESKRLKAKFLICKSNIEEDLTKESKRLKAKFLICKSSKKVVYVEAGGDGFGDLLFSFLTFPLGSVVKLLDKFSSIGCVDNLYSSIEALIADNSCIKVENCKSMLVHPRVAPYFSCSNSLLPCIEQRAMIARIPGCYTCFVNKISTDGSIHCEHRVNIVAMGETNPKLQNSRLIGGGYANKEVKFMITDELEVTPFSSWGSVQIVKKQDVTFRGLEEKDVDVGEIEALNLLKACLTSPNPLTDVFVPKQQGERMQ